MIEVNKSELVVGEHYLFYRNLGKVIYISLGIILSSWDSDYYYADSVPYIIQEHIGINNIYIKNHSKMMADKCDINQETDLIFKLSKEEILNHIIAESL